MAKNMKQNFVLQTHFFGVLLPDELDSEIEESRRYMNGAFGCKSGHRTPLHVTLVPPFHLSDEFSTADIVSALESRIAPISESLRFSARVEGFGAFGERTVFARVLPSEAWLRIRDAVLHAVLEKCPHCTKKDTRPFQPHITIANRDIPAGATAKALIVLNDTALRADFPADNIAVFERENGLWRTAVVIEL